MDRFNMIAAALFLAAAAPPVEQYPTLGVGADLCSEWVSERRANSEYSRRQTEWVLGYVSAL